MILRVVKCGECFTVKSEKSDDGVLNKRTLVLQELGGKYANCYVVSALGNLATIQFTDKCLWMSWQRNLLKSKKVKK